MMETLPDEMIALIFSYLPTEMLVREVRAVCHKWRDLALHPDAWKAHHVDFPSLFGSGSVLYTRVLSLAPCLGYLSLDFEDIKETEASQDMIDLAKTTKCAVRHLRMYIAEGDLPAAAKVLHNQSTRGRLRQLSLSMSGENASYGKVLDTIGDMHLEKLSWMCDMPIDYVPADGEERWGRGSLKKLAFDDPTNDPLFEFLLSRRASTLEVVEVSNCEQESDLSAPWMCHLAQCSKLRKAAVPWVLEVASLANCPDLSELTLKWDGDKAADESFTELTLATIQCLIQLPKLKKLEFNLSLLKSGLGSVVLDVLSALAYRSPSCLEELWLPKFADESLCEKLQISLPGFQSLRTLHLNDLPSRRLLKALIQPAAPNLSMLFLTSGSLTLQVMRRLNKLVQRKRQLHVVIQDLDFSFYSDDSDVPARDYGLYGHVPSSKCHLHVPSVDWHWAG